VVKGIITGVEKTYVTHSEQETLDLGSRIGSQLRGTEVFVLQSDLGGGKTAFTRGIALGIESTDHVASPTFTIQHVYQGKKLTLYHYDFYRLGDAGLLHEELKEALEDEHGIVVMEWAGSASSIVNQDRIVTIKVFKDAKDSEKRTFETSCSDILAYVFEEEK
jgi:tRNA threonylcarbamoyladenosine biosynthesis protein TsaE